MRISDWSSDVCSSVLVVMSGNLWSHDGPALAGGVLIGTAASVLFWCNGRIAGVSGIVAGLLGAIGEQRRWRALFVLGLIAGTGGYVALTGDLPLPRSGFAPAMLIVAGLLVGYGTALGGGCPSGHGGCGPARGPGTETRRGGQKWV